jgi:hypothetical protein
MPKIKVTMHSAMRGKVIVQGASATLEVSEFGAPKKIFFNAMSE